MSRGAQQTTRHLTDHLPPWQSLPPRNHPGIAIEFGDHGQIKM
jgi:hypothetical protein